MNILIKLALLFTILTLIACGDSDSERPTGGRNSTDGGNAGGGSGETPKTTRLSIANAQAGEGENITFTITANPPIAKQISFDYKIDFEGQTNPAFVGDFTRAITGISTIAANSNNTTISIAIADDNIRESNETFRVILSNSAPSDVNVTFEKKTAIGIILANDPTISIADAISNGEENITFTVTTTPPIAKQISFDYEIAFTGQINPAGLNDFSGSTTGKSTIAANSNSTTISIAMVDDNIKESAERFRIQLSGLLPSEANFTQKTAIGTILANDPDGIKTSLIIADAQASEGENITFKVTSAQAIAEQISFKFEATLDNKTMNPASRFDLSSELMGNGTIATNDSSTTISILTTDDSLRENSETFLIILSDLSTTDATFTDYEAIGTITANDATGIVIISVANAEASEDSGKINFKVTSNFNHSQDVTFDYEATLDSLFSAIANDFEATTGTARISADSTNGIISISLISDATLELDETFSLRLTNTSANATLDNNSATGTILNDDVSNINGATATTGDSQIILSWTNPTSNLFAGVTIAQATGTATLNNCSEATIMLDSSKDNHIIMDLINGTAYSFRICARSTSGSISSGVTLTNLTPLIIVDNNNNGLIEIANPTEFNNIRYNLAGTSYKTSSIATGFTRGCPNNICRGYELTANIDLSGNWSPIGNNSNKFTAIFDGKNKTISGLDISSDSDNVGLFSTMWSATISNLKLTKVKIIGNSYVGALVGNAVGNNIFSNIELIGDNLQSSSDAEIKGNNRWIGGLAGQFSGTISDASSSLTVRGSNINASNTGGLIGQFQSGSIKNSNNSGSVYNSENADIVGGLIGYNSGNISNSWASGNISSNGDNNVWYGGLVGYNDATISNSWASGNISSDGIIGGLVGYNSGTTSNSWASGNISGNDVIGGLVGFNTANSTISNSWASGKLKGSYDIGGLVGLNLGNIRNNWASGVVSSSGSISIGGLVGSNKFIFSGGITRSGNINGHNYRLYSDKGNGVSQNNSIELGATTDLANLSGASGDTATIYSDWHAGFDIDNTTDGDNNGTGIDLETRFCDTNGNGRIDDGTVVGNPDERMADNSIWVMPSDSTSTAFPTGISDNVLAPTTDTAGNPADYYAIPALRCTAYTADATNDTEIDRLRKIEIDRQRRLFPR